MTDAKWSSLMKLGVRLRDSGDDLQALGPFHDASLSVYTPEQRARAMNALCVTHRKIGNLDLAIKYGKEAVALARTIEVDHPLVLAACLRDLGEVHHEIALLSKTNTRDYHLEMANSALSESLIVIRLQEQVEVAEEAASMSFLSVIKTRFFGGTGGPAMGAAAVAKLEELGRLGTPHHVYHVNALIRYIRILPWDRRGSWARKALELLPKAGLESRRWDVLIARHFGDRGYRLAKRIAQRLKR